MARVQPGPLSTPKPPSQEPQGQGRVFHWHSGQMTRERKTGLLLPTARSARLAFSRLAEGSVLPQESPIPSRPGQAPRLDSSDLPLSLPGTRRWGLDAKWGQSRKQPEAVRGLGSPCPAASLPCFHVWVPRSPWGPAGRVPPFLPSASQPHPLFLLPPQAHGHQAEQRGSCVPHCTPGKAVTNSVGR